jgi:hypothetical protein
MLVSSTAESEMQAVRTVGGFGLESTGVALTVGRLDAAEGDGDALEER